MTTTNTSLYVGDLTDAVTEAILYEVFREVGPLLSIRVCRDAVTKKSLGYAYVNFQNNQDAERALDTLNYTVLKGRPIRIMWSIRDPSVRKSGIGNIFIKNLDKSIDNKALYDTFSAFGNILSCKVSTKSGGGNKESADPEERSGSRGYGFVHFETQEAAEQAIAKVNGMLLNGKKVYVGPFIKRNERLKSYNVDDKFTNIYIKNLDKSVTTQELEQSFSECGKIQHADVMVDEHGKSKGFAFINFDKHDDAKKAVETFNNKEIKGKKIFVGRAQKRSERIAIIKDILEKKKLDKQLAPVQQGINLYVKNLDDSIDDTKLREIFVKYGEISSAKVMYDEKDNSSKGFGFVCFTNSEDAHKAMSDMNGRMIVSKPLYVAIAQKREARRAQLEAQHRTRQQYPSMGAPMHAPPQHFMPHPNFAHHPHMPPQAFYPQAPPPQMQRPFMPLRPRWAQMPPSMMQAAPPMQQTPNTVTPSTTATSPTSTTPVQPNANIPRPYGNMPMAYAQAVARGGPTGRGGPSKHRGGAVHMGHHQQGYSAPPHQSRGAQRYKYNQNARNRPPEHAMMPHPQQPIIMVPHAITTAPETAPVSADPLTLTNLSEFSPEDQKNIIGDRLFPLVHVSQPEHASKITGMLLEMEISDLLHLIESPDALNVKVGEALTVLQQHSQDAAL